MHPTKPFVVRGYGRASTEEQVLSTEQQESVILEAFKAFQKFKPGWNLAEWGGFYADEATTRTSRFRQRPVGSILIAMSKPGDFILGANFDRVFANVSDVCETLELIEQRKFGVLVLDMDIPLDNDLGQTVFTILAAVKGLEVKEIRRRMRDTAKFRKEKGLPIGHVPIGWRTVGVMVRDRVRKYLVPDERAREIGRRVLSLRQQHQALTMKDFCKLLNSRSIRNGRGRKWNEVTLKTWIKAAIADFPIKNGSHQACPIPPNAAPVPTLGPCD